MSGICLVKKKEYISKMGPKKKKRKKRNGLNSVRGLNDKETTPDSFVYLRDDAKRLV